MDCNRELVRCSVERLQRWQAVNSIQWLVMITVDKGTPPKKVGTIFDGKYPRPFITRVIYNEVLVAQHRHKTQDEAVQYHKDICKLIDISAHAVCDGRGLRVEAVE